MRADLFSLHASVEERHWWFRGRRQIMEQIVSFLLPPGSATTVIDVGCGTGANIAALADRYRCIGIDTTADAIILARLRFPAVEFIHGFAPEDLPQQGSEADLFLLMDVLEHVEDDRRLLDGLIRAARPGTLFLITVPADPRLWTEHDVAFGHFRRYTIESLCALWHDQPVQAEMVSHFNSRLYPVVRWIRTVNRWRGATAGDAGTDLRVPPQPINRLLERTFAGEAARLRSVLRGQREGYPAGVSVIAVLRKDKLSRAKSPTH